MRKGLVCPIDINILPPRYRAGFPLGRVVIILVLLVLAAGLVPVYLAKSQGDVQLAQLDGRLKQLNREILQARQATEGVKLLNDAIARATTSAQTIEGEYKGITDADQGLASGLSSCFDALPPGVNLLSVDGTGPELTLSGEAESTDAVMLYASALKKQFSKVLPSLSKSAKASYPVAFTIVLAK